MKILMCAGGTGGGIYPALAAAAKLQESGIRQDDILWIGTKGEMEETLVPQAGLNLRTIDGGPIVGVPLAQRIRNAARLTGSIGRASQYIREFKPNVMFMTGAYIAAPVSIAARRNRVPIVIYLPDVEPGSTIRYTIPLASKIACTTEGSRQFVPEEKMVVTGYPVRPDIRAAVNLSKAEALAHFDLQPGRPTLFVFGGSRGARNINRALMGVLPTLLQKAQIIHISGETTWPEVEANAAALPDELRTFYRPYPYLHEQMGAALRAADLVVARAGASTLGEFPAFGLPSVLVPLTFAWRYQKVNADYLVERGAAVHLTDETLADTILPTVTGLLDNPERLSTMAAAAARLDKPEALNDLANLILTEAIPDLQQAAPIADKESLC